MNRVCGITPERLAVFSQGGEPVLHEHVAGCEDCLRDLARLWEEESAPDLRQPVLRAVRWTSFLQDLLRLGGGVARRLGTAAVHYTTGRSEQ